MTQPLTFACPKCGRRMGVGLELTGRQVRCPHCRQVVVAPANAPAKPAPSAGPRAGRTTTPPEAFAPSTEGEHPAPKFAPPPRREGAESIFGDSEHEDDSLFASPSVGGRPLIPDLPSSLDLAGQQQPSGVIDFNPAPPDVQSLPATDAIESDNIPRPILGPATPFIKKDLSQPDFELFAKLDPSRPPDPATRPVAIPPTPPVAPPPKADEVVNPWSKLSRPALFGASPAAPPRPTPAPPAGRGTLFWLLVSYAVAVTLFAVWGWARGRTNPLSAIPDFFGQYRQADPKKVSALPVDANQPIPAELRVKLGERIVLGELEFEPVSVEERKTTWEVKDEPNRSRAIECLVLTARVRNVSPAHSFCPLDPAFNRFAAANEPPPLSAVLVGADRYPGGPIPWPFATGTSQYVLGQERDGDPLQPGQELTTVVPSIDGEKGQKLRDGVRAAKGPVLWQVHVRRGFISYQGEEVSVGALIGVEFTADQVKR